MPFNKLIQDSLENQGMDYRIVNYIIIWTLGRRGMRLQPEQQNAPENKAARIAALKTRITSISRLEDITLCLVIIFILRPLEWTRHSWRFLSRHHDLPFTVLRFIVTPGNYFWVIIVLGTRHSENNGEDGLRASRTTGWTSYDFPLLLELSCG
ncbi:hypothetical protein ABFA07_007904 [Porites harrisoni]